MLEDGYVLQQVSVCIFSTAIATTRYGGCYPELLCCDFSNCSFTLNACGALPNYIPNLRRGNGDRDALIEDYFGLGFSYSEVLSFLQVYHDIRLSLRDLKRILKKRGLHRRNIQSSVETVIDAVEDELQWSVSTIGH